jgi:Cys/Met metabolism PLP-dependent enzyme
MISFGAVGREAEAFRFLDHLKLIELAVSVGGTQSLAEHPATICKRSDRTHSAPRARASRPRSCRIASMGGRCAARRAVRAEHHRHGDRRGARVSLAKRSASVDDPFSRGWISRTASLDSTVRSRYEPSHGAVL